VNGLEAWITAAIDSWRRNHPDITVIDVLDALDEARRKVAAKGN
jgi:hypothetical protein